MIQVFLEKEKQRLEKEFSGSVAELLVLLSVNPETVLVVKNGEVVAEDEVISDKDEIKLLSVISGG